jgi:RecG-like helicase
VTRQRASATGRCDDDPIATTIAGITRRQRCELDAAIVSIEVSERPTLMLDVTVADDTGTLVCTFFGRREIPGFAVGRSVRVAGRLVRYRDRQCLLNPVYEFADDGRGPIATSS